MIPAQYVVEKILSHQVCCLFVFRAVFEWEKGPKNKPWHTTLFWGERVFVTYNDAYFMDLGI